MLEYPEISDSLQDKLKEASLKLPIKLNTTQRPQSTANPSGGRGPSGGYSGAATQKVISKRIGGAQSSDSNGSYGFGSKTQPVGTAVKIKTFDVKLK